MNDMIIGREAGVPKEQARLAIEMDGKVYYMGAKGSVPANVSKKHCRISFDSDNKMTVEDITDNNFMYIDGMDCKRKEHVALTDSIELGPGKYRLDMESIVKALSANQSYSIAHLEPIYNNYQKAKYDIQVKERRFNALSALPGVLSMASIGLAFVIPDGRVVMIVVATIFALAFGLVRFSNATKIPQKTIQLENDFREHYICPNPACNHFMGMAPYKELIKNRSCPYCKCKFKD